MKAAPYPSSGPKVETVFLVIYQIRGRKWCATSLIQDYDMLNCENECENHNAQVDAGSYAWLARRVFIAIIKARWRSETVELQYFVQ